MKNFKELQEQAVDQWTSVMSHNATETEIVDFWANWMEQSYVAGVKACGKEIEYYCPRSTERVSKFLSSL